MIQFGIYITDERVCIYQMQISGHLSSRTIWHPWGMRFRPPVKPQHKMESGKQMLCVVMTIHYYTHTRLLPNRMAHNNYYYLSLCNCTSEYGGTIKLSVHYYLWFYNFTTEYAGQYNSIYHSTIVPLSYVVQLSVFYYLSFSYWTIENDSKIQLAAYYNLSLSNCTNKYEGTIQTDCLLFYHSTNIPLNVMVQYNWLLVFPWHLYYYWCLIRDVWMK